MSSAAEVTPPPPPPQGPPVRGHLAQAALLSLPVVGALGVVGVMAWAGGWFQGGPPSDAWGSTAVFVLWNLAPFAGAAAVVVATRRYGTAGTGVLALGLVALVAIAAWLLQGMVTSESSTAALLLLVLPFHLGLLLGLVAVAAALAQGWQGRRDARRTR